MATIAAAESACSLNVLSAIVRGTIAVPVDNYEYDESLTPCSLQSTCVVDRLSWYPDCHVQKTNPPTRTVCLGQTVPLTETTIKRAVNMNRMSTWGDSLRSSCSIKYLTVLV
jgi:hypothetical protein